MNTDEPLGTLTREDLIVLFEWAYQFCSDKKLKFRHPAEIVVIDKIASDLETVIKEPFSTEYSTILDTARKQVFQEYVKKMGSDTWIHEFQRKQEQ
jgi:hypothetical protein